MKITKLIKPALLIAAILGNGSAAAYSPEESEVACKKPRFTDFNLTTYNATENIEVAPESEFYFKISPWVNPSTIKLSAKNQPLAFTVESNNSFHKVKAKLPAALTGLFVRINTSAKAALGCDDQAGWLVKVAKQ
ncbi:MAG: hypothetical protein Q8N96_06725 [Methylovulum sp.]|nr:hypothetical protein [Methylovulum sp.]